jgi:hypothetical protein
VLSDNEIVGATQLLLLICLERLMRRNELQAAAKSSKQQQHTSYRGMDDG